MLILPSQQSKRCIISCPIRASLRRS
ncbi:hypothetical protein ACHAWC_001139 [Mediolabrus comicus]